MPGMIGIAFVGCGYVAELYIETLSNWNDVLELKGVYDHNSARSETFCEFYSVRRYEALQDILNDPGVDIVINLTNPSSHYAVTKACLEAGHHVYSEKPIALTIEQVRELVALAQAKDLHLVCAPSSVLGIAAQTLVRAVSDQVRGAPRLVYADMDDGMVHRIGYENWKTPTGVHWPATDEFQTGCTLEHAGYVVSWLVAMFGSVKRLTTTAHLLVLNKGDHTPAPYSTPDFSCAVLEFEGGVCARVTNSIVATHDHRLRVFCDDGVLSMKESWNYSERVRSAPLGTTRVRRQIEKKLGWDLGHYLPPVTKKPISTAKFGYKMDFALGVAEMAMALRDGKTPRLAGDFSLHISEVSIAIQHPEIYGAEYIPQSVAPSVRPMEY